jgi:prepilin-type N-terminal cleavage/methylation domain-containing protein
MMLRTYHAPLLKRAQTSGGYTLVELMIAVGLFAIIMLLCSGAYLMMISLNRQAQTITTGIDNLAFALESMTRSVRTGSAYSCGAFGGDCTSGGTSLSFKNQQGTAVTYALSGTSLIQTVGSVQSALTDSSVTITSLMFYAYGTKPAAQSDLEQARVTIVVTGTVSPGPGKAPQSFTIETGATLRGSDI